MPTLRQLTYLIALEDERHFRRAATKCNVTQPTLSTQIQECERSLGATLVDRSAKTVSLTPLGAEVAARARRILAEVEDIRDLASASQHGFHGTVRLGVPPTLGAYLLPHVVPHLHKLYPDLKLYVREAKPDALQAGLREGRYDVVFTPMPLREDDLTIAPLFREPLLVACSNDHPLAARETLTRADLKGQKVLAIEPGHHLHDKVAALCEDFGAELLRDYEGTSLDTLRLMVGMGVGIAFLPSLYIRSEIGARGELTVKRLEAANLHRQIAMAWRERSANAALFKDMAKVVRERVGSDLPEVTLLT